MTDLIANGGFHYSGDVNLIVGGLGPIWNRSSYNFATFTHPFVGDLIGKLNQDSLAGMLAPGFLGASRRWTTPRSTRRSAAAR